jgi:hypothetical protein
MPDRNLGNCPDFVAAHESGSGVRYCGASEVLRNGCERELILSTAWAAQPKPAKPQNAFEMGKQHLNALAAATRLLESLGLGRCASDIAGVLMQIARYISHRRSGTIPHLERADIAVGLGGTKEERRGGRSTGSIAGGSVITASPLVAPGMEGPSYGRSRPGRHTGSVMALAPLCGGARLRIRP